MSHSNTINLNNIDHYLMARLFSPSVIREMIAKGRSKTFANILQESGIASAFKSKEMVRDIFDPIFELLLKNYRNEYVYKSMIAKNVLLGRHSLNTAVMLTEFRVANNKADVVILNGSARAYEIKSELDNLERLPAQIAAYLKVFAEVCVIGSINNYESICSIVPPETGILILNRRGNISTLREPVSNLDRTESVSMFDVMQLNEAKKVLLNLGFDIPVVPNTKIHRILREMFIGLDPEQVHREMVKVLKNSRSQKAISDFLNSIPGSIQAAVLSLRVNSREQARLTEALNEPLINAKMWS